MRAWDGYIDSLSPKRDYKRKRREVIVTTFNRLLTAAKKRHAVPLRIDFSEALSDQERDYRSIANVIARFERPVGTADLGRYRRRWLEYPPRAKDSPYRNRLEEILAKMVADGVLKATRGMAGGQLYLLQCRAVTRGGPTKPAEDATAVTGEPVVAPLDILRCVPLFAELNEDDLEEVARLFKERRFAAGETVAKEGSGGAAFYVVGSGEARAMHATDFRRRCQ